MFYFTYHIVVHSKINCGGTDRYFRPTKFFKAGQHVNEK